MNTANLQLEGLYLAIAALNNALVEKGVMSREEVATAMRRAEQTALGDYRNDELSGAERDAVAFAPRLLNLANNSAADGQTPSFSELAKLVGQTKPRHPDRM
ncbi:MAG: hypothetical protein JWP99_543 [Devosia sp.]|nr:hypothetical protein [Devosia sp.]